MPVDTKRSRIGFRQLSPSRKGEKPLPPWTVTWTRAGEGTAFAFEIIIRARQASSHAR
jgi:hypothetical protein